MSQKMLIDASHNEETRVVVLESKKVEDFDFESFKKLQLSGNIYLAKVTRVEPSLQAAFLDYGANRHGFLAFSEIHPDYYQIPIADREALMEEERAYAEAQRELEEGGQAEKKRSRVKSRAKNIKSDDSIQKHEVEEDNTGEALDSGLSVAGESETTFDSDPDDNLTVKTDIKNSELSNDSSDLIDSVDKVDPSNEISAEDGLNEIESILEADDPLDLRVISKPRPRRYKIQEVIKVRQILLVQVVKEERGNKGAALTTYLSLAGRYCVLMPNTARGGGISRKITNAVDRKKLKEIAGDIEVPTGAVLISVLVLFAPAVRTIKPAPEGTSISPAISFNFFLSTALVIFLLIPPPLAVFGMRTQ
jgi:ribonuclease E